jgi:hypothetical protein
MWVGAMSAVVLRLLAQCRPSLLGPVCKCSVLKLACGPVPCIWVGGLFKMAFSDQLINAAL